ncbi:MAG: PDZ domain-containing protein, partial [Longimicrobiales bacterium]
MNESLRIKLGAVTLVLLSVAAMIYGAINFQQRSSFITADDGVAWIDSPGGVQAWQVAAGSPADAAGIKPGDRVLSMDDAAVGRATQVTQRLWKAGVWTQVVYRLERAGAPFEAKVITAPAEKPASIENYLRFVGLLYLFIGLFIFARRWNAPRAVHFYVFCLVSFVLYTFQYSGKLNEFDWQIYWADAVALLLQPAILLHFALVFPERQDSFALSESNRSLMSLLYLPALLLGAARVAVVMRDGINGSIVTNVLQIIERGELMYLALSLLLGLVIMTRALRRVRSVTARRQLRWIVWGTALGAVPFIFGYGLPWSLGFTPLRGFEYSAVLLGLV